VTILVTGEMMLEHNGKQVGGYSNYWIYLTNLKTCNEGYLLNVYLYFLLSHEYLKIAYNKFFITKLIYS